MRRDIYNAETAAIRYKAVVFGCVCSALGLNVNFAGCGGCGHGLFKLIICFFAVRAHVSEHSN